MNFKEFMDGYYDVSAQLSSYLQGKASKYFVLEWQTKQSIDTIKAFEERREYVRKYFIEAIGGLDIEKTPLNTICTGVIDKEHYEIKKVVFQSQPGIYVTSNLYMPKNVKSEVPAVLFACGHAQEAKAYPGYQRICIDLVLNGFAVLAVDPIGQGERMQYYNSKLDRTLINWGTMEHSYAGLQCDLTGSSIARYFIWDLIRALDYLCSLPEVDANRIGMTGNSGGGTQTSYMMLVDDRLKAAIPCTYITSREDYMKTGQAHDSEQNIFGAISEGLNYDDFIACFAPKPVMIGAVESDFFCIEGTIKSYERAKKIYSLYNSADNIKLCITKGTHAYNEQLRQAAVNWFIKHVKGEERCCFITDPNTPVERPEMLQCTNSGQVVKDFDDAETVFDLNVSYFSKNKYQDTTDIDIIKEKIKSVLNMPAGDVNKVYPRVIGEETANGIDYSKIFFFSERDVIVSGIYMNLSENRHNKCTILLLEEGTDSIYKEINLVKQFLKQGSVFVFDVRGTGGVKSREINGRGYNKIFGTQYKLNLDAMMMKTSLCGLRVFDVLRAYDVVNQMHPCYSIQLAGKDIGAIYALFASVLNDDIRDVYLENMITSFEEIITTKYYKYNVCLDIYGVLKEFDIPEILRAMQYKNIELCNSPVLLL